ncbi:hypothetical protein ALC60_09008 [Trachymyrmex zeteki]|uniref:Uncharacterized protein n=1 Tax=Mycetomoellerius zeteki TaxID=64791 RepID=A0A151WVG0_9HYME|nr:hypothetical protein ALC60_09008 [Trachymyrmex zeteki]
MSQDVGMQADSNPPLAKSHRLCASRFVTVDRRPPISQLAPRGSSLIACWRRYTRPKRAVRERKRQLPALLRDGPLSYRLRMPFAGVVAVRGKGGTLRHLKRSA